MKKITYLLIMLLAINFSYGQTTLAEGDIAITGVNADNPDQFSFVLLTDVLTGTIINFTDGGWNISGGFRGYNPSNGRISEGVVVWTSTTDLSCGTEIIITDTGSNTHSATSGLATEVADTGFNLASAGDELIVYQGSASSPTFLYAVHYANANGWTDATDTNNSAIPSGLTNGINAIDLGNNDNSNYLCTVTSNQALILDAVANVNATNWYQTNSNTVINRPILGGCTYTCTVAGSCASTITWNGTWVGGTPDLTTEVVISANYNANSLATSFKACSLLVDPSITLTIDNGAFIEVENDVIVNGDLIVQTQGNFVQNDNSGAFTLNASGVARVNKLTASKDAWYYYTYWSSPVTNETIASVFPDVDGDRRFYFDATLFVDTDGDDIDDNGDDWQYALGGDTMIPGVGYAVTEARLFPSGIGASGSAAFEGPFNTGDVDVSISQNPLNAIESWNFIGNPYPSAIDFIAFQQANSTIIDGAAYFWSQASPPDASNPGNEPLNFNLNDYAVFNVGVGGAAGGDPLKIPTGYIASAQGFFIPALTSGTATFTNAMRMADGASNNQFFKGSKSKKSTRSSNVENKLWVNLTSGNGVFNQILVGYVDGATNNNDGVYYDAPKLLAQDYAAALYSLMETDLAKYVIQGKNINSIDENEIIKLGFSTNVEVATIYKLSVAQIEGDFLTSNTIYLKDNLLKTLHNLSASDYTFTSEVGEFNERFEIVFSANALSIEDISTNANTLKIVELEDDRVQFTTSKTIKTVSIYDLLGRQLYAFKGQKNSETYTLSNLSSTIYIAKVELSNGATITKKAFKK